ncbi:CapA family protein [Sorangium sp. So ce381]|uniref:CapA family protein n=1 Tax=Sorangium sp. So ce381 TaxID=3133307 RepID=UPI003F5C8806
MRPALCFLATCAVAAQIGCERPANVGAGLAPPPAVAPAAPRDAAEGPREARAAAAAAAAPAAAATAARAAAATAARAAAATAARAAAAPADAITLIAGGDVCLGKALGQELLRDPAYDPFASVAALFASADVRFVNLENQLSDQRGETQHARQPLVFVGPPAGADALARAGIGVVSLANNHMWDYGKGAFLETLGHLERAGVAYVGAGRTRLQAYAPAVVERRGFRVALLAVTGIWNQGSLWQHPAREFVAGAERDGLAAAVRAARKQPGVDAVVVSYHGGTEYLDTPLPQARALAGAAIDAGADAFLGHHPHVLQGIELRRGRPIFYSLGNFLMKVKRTGPAVELAMLARLRLRRGAPPLAEICPVRSEGLGTVPLAADPRRAETEAAFAKRMRRVSAFVKGEPAIGPFAADGCAPLEPAAKAAPAPRPEIAGPIR